MEERWKMPSKHFRKRGSERETSVLDPSLRTAHAHCIYVDRLLLALLQPFGPFSSIQTAHSHEGSLFYLIGFVCDLGGLSEISQINGC